MSVNATLIEAIIANYQTDCDDDWNKLSCDPSVTMDIIMKHPEKPWNWDYISRNPNLTIEFVKKYPLMPWDLEWLHQNRKWNV